ncbi:hypothetical protein NQ314_001512 [Rhamnusium bicolor]|uniref:DDE Tnp4 domain-containing protein n=1 Tax=Rhamnusium bicolor TaxID=1586634 RepID=A0AAV8ZUW2_9CUCU|nr:hypothetical protein NQ314_001512 [Rhamnusium bicolor]
MKCATKEVAPNVLFENLPSTSKDVCDHRGSNLDIEVPSTSKQSSMSDISLEDRPSSRSESRLSTTSSSSSLLEAENYLLKKQVEELQNQLKSLKVGFDFSAIENNDALINVYTGLPDKALFMAVFKYLDSQNFHYNLGWSVVNISRINQFLMTCMKLKLNPIHKDLALRFGCSVATVSNIVITWLHVMHVCLYKKFLENQIPTRHKNKTCMPSSFSPFTNCKMVIDCTEIYTEVPSQLDKQKYTYSSYKHRNTLTGLVGVAPNGTITFLSNLYVGNTSDKNIVKHCGVLTSFLAGDLILADKGFLIQDLLPPGVLLNIPPFLMKAQFSPEEARQTVTIARARIHVERAIRRIKEYKILQLIPQNLRPYSSMIFQVCGFLTTLNYPLIKEVEDRYFCE